MAGRVASDLLNSEDPVLLNDEIANLAIQLSHIQHRQTLLLLRLKEVAATKTSIQSLPSEIVAMIFNAADTISRRDDTFAQLPRCVARVCRTWRKIALNLTSLWTHIAIPIDRDLPFSMIHSHLHRSGSRLLEIVIGRSDGNYDDDGLEAARLAGVMKVLSISMNRWKTLSIHCINSRSLEGVIADTRGRAEQLVEVNFMPQFLDDLGLNLNPRVRESVFLECPSLRKLVIDGCTFTDSCAYGLWKESIHGLRSLTIFCDDVDIDPISFHAMIKPLTCWRNLGTLRFQELEAEVDFSLWTINPRPHFRLEALKELYFEGVSGEILSEFFKITITPSLEIVEISTYKSDRLMSTTLPPFNTLRISKFESYDLLSSLIISFKGQNLELQSIDEHDIVELLDKPIYRDNWYCNQMVSLTLCSIADLSSHALRQAIENRWNASLGCGSQPKPAVLQKLVVHGCEEISVQDRAWFTENLDIFFWGDEL